ncbi:fluoride efflux transporter CrcB [Lewinella sp. IMCC34191]|uniref:fluoride efflux transporter CrcB n=1 Tax=Lewinella sp. IMCC34191 TaxID=2259172 RepID=UPI0013009884|nr:fluoride efflux transporter CrcB [Lewinella sp. IMCC34191]
MTWFLVFLGGGLGASARYALAQMLPAGTTESFPWATFGANFLACIVLGLGLSLATKQQISPGQQLLLLTGFCGGFSTFSTFSAELLALMQEGHLLMASLYLAASLIVGIGSIFLVLYSTSASAS